MEDQRPNVLWKLKASTEKYCTAVTPPWELATSVFIIPPTANCSSGVCGWWSGGRFRQARCWGKQDGSPRSRRGDSVNCEDGWVEVMGSTDPTKGQTSAVASHDPLRLPEPLFIYCLTDLFPQMHLTTSFNSSFFEPCAQLTSAQTLMCF